MFGTFWSILHELQISAACQLNFIGVGSIRPAPGALLGTGSEAGWRSCDIWTSSPCLLHVRHMSITFLQVQASRSRTLSMDAPGKALAVSRCVVSAVSPWNAFGNIWKWFSNIFVNADFGEPLSKGTCFSGLFLPLRNPISPGTQNLQSESSLPFHSIRSEVWYIKKECKDIFLPEWLSPHFKLYFSESVTVSMAFSFVAYLGARRSCWRHGFKWCREVQSPCKPGLISHFQTGIRRFEKVSRRLRATFCCATWSILKTTRTTGKYAAVQVARKGYPLKVRSVGGRGCKFSIVLNRVNCRSYESVTANWRKYWSYFLNVFSHWTGNAGSHFALHPISR